MGFFNTCWDILLYFSTFSPLSSFSSPGLGNQHVLGPDGDRIIIHPEGASPGFTCSYPALSGWVNCNGPDSRDCWLTNPNAPQPKFSQYDINTDYEEDWPQGITREYWLEVSDNTTFAPDGFVKNTTKLFNGTYPGPLIEACWGDEVIIHVTNNLTTNGTTIHWHGVRQLHTNEMDGVNGVTQCPIAPQDSFTYRFNVTQYGHTWYHSHYSLQYPDGVAGPLVFHGPNSANWDIDLGPVFIADWVHDSAFAHYQTEIAGLPPNATSILLNGHGHYNCSATETCVNNGSYFETTFEQGKKHMMRVINGAAGTSFIFSIDNHNLTIVSTDLVPIKPYTTNSLFVGIGQRYGVIIEANPDQATADGNYWIRTEPANGCGVVEQTNGFKTGIVRYNSTSTADPTSPQQTYNNNCTDEPRVPGVSIEPVFPWVINSHPENNVTQDTFQALHDNITAHNYTHWEMTGTPLWLNFSNPTILNLGNSSFDPQYCIVDYDFSHGYVYLVITAGPTTPVTHPIHLHGHDFVILAQSFQAYDEQVSPQTFNYANPTRRDVAMLPGGGYLALAFRPDNPGVWLVHCHIVWHASSGLALQVLERQEDIVKTLDPSAIPNAKNTCDGWNAWLSTHSDIFNQNESGI